MLCSAGRYAVTRRENALAPRARDSAFTEAPNLCSTLNSRTAISLPLPCPCQLHILLHDIASGTSPCEPKRASPLSPEHQRSPKTTMFYALQPIDWLSA